MPDIFLPLLAGYILRRWVFKEEDARVLINYVLYFALPITSFMAAHRLGINREVISIVLLAWSSIIFCILLAWLVGKLFSIKGPTLRSFLLVSSFGNTAFLGYPYTVTLLGKEALPYAVIYDNLGSFLLVSSVGITVATGRPDIRRVITFPPFLALLIGFITRPIEIPPYLYHAMELVSSSLPAVILFSMGLLLNLSHLKRGWGKVLGALLIKMGVSPLLTAWILQHTTLPDPAYKTVLLQSSMPPMLMAGVLSVRYGLDVSLAFTSIGAGMLISFLTVPLIGRIIEK
ncbi:Auxin Efflux Carrier [Thermocrinis albus DSM 14484]|uniref:Auxin Efflux Carrier n=1 Tax=Thermocrinis albus (strain DSM 14484 / JCM 11386 / HI 11/12) TaxID=638303 RepID=D3SPT0_THEAH|nr:AEC family transporter [Thermocrinis albus]ADC89167.1 Auxin Efflux Carrier [Thermocrinis albus DSM 14484]